MFETPETAEIRMPSLVQPGLRVWNHVAHGLQIPWFHISITSQDDGASVVFATDLEQLLRLQSGRRPHQQITVQLVSPPWMNGTDEWRMEALREVWQDHSKSRVVYIVKGLRRYGDSEPDAQCISLEGLERVFEQPPLQPGQRVPRGSPAGAMAMSNKIAGYRDASEAPEASERRAQSENFLLLQLLLQRWDAAPEAKAAQLGIAVFELHKIMKRSVTETPAAMVSALLARVSALVS